LTTRHRRGSGRRAEDGGVAARRAVIRWAWRLFRREWRQQFLILALLTVAVAATVFSVSAAYNLVPSAGARFGTASHRLELERADRRPGGGSGSERLGAQRRLDPSGRRAAERPLRPALADAEPQRGRRPGRDRRRDARA